MFLPGESDMQGGCRASATCLRPNPATTDYLQGELVPTFFSVLSPEERDTESALPARANLSSPKRSSSWIPRLPAWHGIRLVRVVLWKGGIGGRDHFVSKIGMDLNSLRNDSISGIRSSGFFAIMRRTS